MHPFRIEVPEADLADLRDRLARTRWPDPATVPGWAQGVPLDYTRDLCESLAHPLQLAPYSPAGAVRSTCGSST